MGQIKAPEIPRPINALGLEEEALGSIEEYADQCAATMVQQMTIAGDDDDNSIEEYIKQACIDGAQWQREQMLKQAVSGITHLVVDVWDPYETVIRTDAVKNIKHGTLIKFIILKEN